MRYNDIDPYDPLETDEELVLFSVFDIEVPVSGEEQPIPLTLDLLPEE